MTKASIFSEIRRTAAGPINRVDLQVSTDARCASARLAAKLRGGRVHRGESRDAGIRREGFRPTGVQPWLLVAIHA